MGFAVRVYEVLVAGFDLLYAVDYGEASEKDRDCGRIVDDEGLPVTQRPNHCRYDGQPH